MSLRDYADLRGISCLICSKRLEQRPKKLLCHHRYCETCLMSLLSIDNTSTIVTCPVCEHSTSVVNPSSLSCLDIDVKLQIKIYNVSNLLQFCTNCDLSRNNTAAAEIYCQICELFMCSMCHRKHDDLKPMRKHRTYSVDEIRAGSVFLDTKIPCKNHSGDEGGHFCTLVCITCKKAICEKCKTVVHDGHDVQELSRYQDISEEKTKSLQEETAVAVEDTKRRLHLVTTEEHKAFNHINNVTRTVRETAGIAINEVKDRENTLIRQTEDYKRNPQEKYKEIRTVDERRLTQLKSSIDLISRSSSSRFGVDTVAIRAYLTRRLRGLVALEVDEVEFQRQLAEITTATTRIEFTPDVNKLLLGKITCRPTASASYDYDVSRPTASASHDYETIKPIPDAPSDTTGRNTWTLTQDIKLPAESPMQCLTATPDGNIAVGHKRNGIFIYSRSDNAERKSVIPLISDVSGLAFTSKGYFVARTRCNKVMMFTDNGDKLDVKFNANLTMWTFLKKGVCGNVTVDGDDNVYVNHIRDMKIEVFSTTGGKPLRTISCRTVKPEDIFAMKTRKMLVIGSGGQYVSLIDECGRTKRQVNNKAPERIFPALRPDDSILVARVNLGKGLLSVDHYSQDLDFLDTIIGEKRIRAPKKAVWFALQESLSGDIAFCTSERLYLFSLTSS